MINYIQRRLHLFFFTSIILSLLSFFLTFKISNPKPIVFEPALFFEYIHFLGDLLKGDLGISKIDGSPILEQGLIHFASTIELCFLALLLALIFGIPLGIIAGIYKNRLIDHLIITLAAIGLALPVFLLAAIFTMLPITFEITFPIDGNISPMFEFAHNSKFLLLDTLIAQDKYFFAAFFNRLAHLLLPTVALSFFLFIVIIRCTRRAVTNILQCNFIKAAYASGSSTLQIVLQHVIKNALPSIIHHLRLQMSTVISFAMVIEIISDLQGLGDWLLNSMYQGDYMALPAGLLIISLSLLLADILIDILLMVISPLKRKAIYADQ